MKDLKRCPYCFKLPTLTTNKNGQWTGGCTTGLTEMCSLLKGVVLQPTLESAAYQWNFIVDLMPVLKVA